MVIKAVGFDLDGTLFATHVNYDALNNADRTVLEKHGIPFEEVFGNNPEPKRTRAPIRKWLEDHGRSEEYGVIYREIDDLSLSIETEFVSEAKAYPGSIECIDILKSEGLKVGLLTRGGYEYARQVLTRSGIMEKMDAVMGRDYSTYDEAKPSPIAMKQFAKELGVEPEEILYLGDNVTDYRSASGAGATFIGVLSGAGSKELWKKTDPSIRTLPFAGDVVKVIDEYI